MKKRCICLLLALLCALPTTGCSDSEIDAEDTTTAPTDTAEPELTDGLPETDMAGYTFHVLNTPPDSLTWADVRIYADDLNGEAVNDGLFTRRQTIENRFNCRMTAEESIPYGNIPSTLQAAVNAGDAIYQSVFVSEQFYGNSLPYCISWDDIPHIDYEEAHWNPNATSVFNICGRQTALAGNVSLSVLSRAVCMVFNKNIFSELFPGENLYAIVEEDKWVLDTMLSYASSAGLDTNGDGVWTADDQYGLNMGRGFKGYIASILRASGFHFTTQAEDGTHTFTMHTNEASLTLVTRLMDIMMQNGFYYNEDTTCGGFKPADFFSSGHALFTQGVPHDIFTLRDMEDDLGILPMPKLTEEQENYYSASWGGHVLMLPKTVTGDKDLENIGILLEAMSFIGYYELLPMYKEVALKSKTSRDEESPAMLDIIYASAAFDFGTNILYDSILTPKLLQILWDDKDSSAIVSTCLKQENLIQEYIDIIMKAAEEMP